MSADTIELLVGAATPDIRLRHFSEAQSTKLFSTVETFQSTACAIMNLLFRPELETSLNLSVFAGWRVGCMEPPN